MRRFVRCNGLTLVMTGLFLAALVGQAATGFRVHNQDQTEHGEPTIGVSAYLTSGHFVEAVFENWESEFLQMGAYVFLTVFLFQKGSPESKDPDAPEGSEEETGEVSPDERPWPVRRGGVALRVYEHSLSLALLLLFVGAFLLHAYGGAREASQEAMEHGEAAVSFVDFLGSAQLWFQSFQNWQSEFLSVATLVALAIFLREKGSPESKPVGAPHGQTGS